MYKAPSKERNLGIRTNSDWRHRPISPSNSTSTPVRSASPNIPSPLPRPGRQNTTSKSVAALQQQWQQQQQQQQEPPLKPPRYPLTRRVSSEIKYTPESTNDVEVIYDDDEGDDVEEERMVVIQDVRSRSPSIHRGSTGSVQSYFGQEFRVVKEGWMYRKNGLMVNIMKIITKKKTLSLYCSSGNLFTQLLNMGILLSLVDSISTRTQR